MDYLKKLGIKSTLRSSYRRLFNNKELRESSGEVLEDLCIRFHFYQAGKSNDPLVLARMDAYREIILYIMTMSSRLDQTTLEGIEKFINRE